MQAGRIFLTSTGLSSSGVVKKLKELVTDSKKWAVAIVTTAAEGKENNKYSKLAKEQFLDMGFETVDFVDLETEPTQNFHQYDIVYVCGGNTFKLLKFARSANFKTSVTELLRRDGIYIGVSAGSLIIGPSIEIAGVIVPDENAVGLSDLKGLSLIDQIVFPHYTESLEKEVAEFEQKHSVKVERITNSQAIFLQGTDKIVLE